MGNSFIDPYFVRNRLQIRADDVDRQPFGVGFFESLTRGQKGALIGWFNYFLKADSVRYLLWAWVFNANKPLHSSDLTDGQWMALYEWLNPYQDEDGWQPDPVFPDEMFACVEKALIAEDGPKSAIAEALRLGGKIQSFLELAEDQYKEDEQ